MKFIKRLVEGVFVGLGIALGLFLVQAIATGAMMFFISGFLGN